MYIYTYVQDSKYTWNTCMYVTPASGMWTGLMSTYVVLNFKQANTIHI